MPPGTGDVHLTIAQTVSVTGAVIVTTPQQVAVIDAKKALGMFAMAKINVPIIGVVENMAYFTPDELPNKRYYLFGKDGGKKLAEEYEVPFLGEIPIQERVREGGDDGMPVVLDESNLLARNAFIQIAEKMAQNVAISNAKKAAAETV
jgi:ATP-binding protein involved in chromosome partitioning